MKRIRNYLLSLTNKIAFYPTLISFFGIALALFIIYLENKGVSAYLLDTAPVLVIDNTETARIILSAFITGLISLMVFSFSMVMVLLSQASSNFSPRVLPGLISNKRHQVVLGLYLGAILYNLFGLVAIEPDGSDYQTPGFLVLIGIVFTIICLGSFIYFIHSISESIQVNNILKRIYTNTRAAIENCLKNEKQPTGELPNFSAWREYRAGKSGYFQGLLINSIAKICREEGVQIFVPLFKGAYVMESTIGFMANIDLDEDITHKILSNFLYSEDEFSERNPIYGFKQITEIALKAMSPGINDPGTALNAIDYLSGLFSLLMKRNNKLDVVNLEGGCCIYFSELDFSTILCYVMAALRQYCRHDSIVVERLMHMLETLGQQCLTKKETEVLKKELFALKEDALKYIENNHDRARLNLVP
ncbi:MAG: hypothetical protein CMH48_10510 [Muricauda sp.]|nr:DUF2254 domain-containing protein [Allomuricauda sp.]MAU25940.1 hypothetical protein [Allomuricauda sp.]MBC31266.1 hypothetical protein [Allomuricauda sp.]